MVVDSSVVERRRPEPANRRGVGRFRSWLRGDRSLLAVLLVAFVAARLSIAARVEAFRTFDTRSYAGLLDGPNPTATVSFTGHAPRLWGTPLLYSLAGSDPARAWAQALIGTAAWVLLVLALWIALRTTTARVCAATALFVLALTRAVYVWDHTLTAESLSISLGLLAFGLLALWARRRSWPLLAATVLVTVWWMFVRQDMLLFIALVPAVLVVLAWRDRSRRWPAVVALGALLAGLAWNAALLGPTDQTFSRWSASGRSQTDETFLYRLMVEVQRDPAMHRAYHDELGMPQCQAIEDPALVRRWNVRKFSEAYARCGELQTWAEEHELGVGFRYALAEPEHYREIMGHRILPMALGSTELHTYGRPVTMLPEAVGSVFYPPRHLALPLIGGAAALALLACVATGAVRRRRWLTAIGVVGGLVSVASVLASLMLSAGEYTRFGIQEAIYLRISLVVLAVAALDAGLTRRRERAGASARGESGEAAPRPYTPAS
ncbi:hypothetical protein CO540_09130 [Micromonospora sp. WMMA2032]|uniref:hypothetical protein n=1 Tax=Micromonospora sp. WMMA2032 TaxID=2039870 RepID=UPI000C05AF4A|nr:hypothetical protein [Micromonospora sp. WMMA2032]ATO13974.1 hypothetical protein CO540_09130 [Micromonospora sp. WMMA2032]